MRPRGAGVVVAMCFAATATACVGNTAPGNDREAALDPPPRPAQTASAEAAIAGVDVSLLHPQIMTEADLASTPAECRFRFTRVGHPVFVYSLPAVEPGVVKLNGKLVPLDPDGNGRFASGGVSVELRRVDAEAGEPGPQATDLVLTLPGAPDELGYRGSSECGG